MTVDEPRTRSVTEAELDLDVLAVQQASTWPVLDEDGRRELGRLLSSAA
ncbi:hypothetical protein [Brevibacterium linens]|nr:hypothetical protein [Brevibacterium linens]